MTLFKWQEYESLARERLGPCRGLSYFTERVLDRCLHPGSRDQVAEMAAWTDKLRFKKMAAHLGFRVPKVHLVWGEKDKGNLGEWMKDAQDFVVKPTHLSGHVWLPSREGQEDPTTWFDMRHGPAVRLFDGTTQLCKPWYDFSPRVFAEERVSDPTDWKFYVIGGRVRCCIVCWDRGSGRPLKYELLDRAGSPAKVDLHVPRAHRHPLPGLALMYYRRGVDLAERLADHISGPAEQFVRLDFFYDPDRGWLACELDWAPGHYGMRRVSPESVDQAWGRYWLESYYA
jgi:hypothetical protein